MVKRKHNDWVVVDGVAMCELSVGVLTIDEADLPAVQSLYGVRYREDHPVTSSAGQSLARTLTGLAADDKRVVGYRDCDVTNCRRSNLVVRAKGLGRSRGKPSDQKTSIYKGVYFDEAHSSQPWCATIKPAGHTTQLVGHFASEEEAADAYDRAAVKHYGPEVMTNARLVALGKIKRR